MWIPCLWKSATLPQYREMLSRVSGIGSGEELQQILACAEKQHGPRMSLPALFGIFESGEFEPIKDFMQSEDYLSIRDQFMAGTMEYWKGKTYIPVSRERMWFLRKLFICPTRLGWLMVHGHL